jgi:outer membrane protein
MSLLAFSARAQNGLDGWNGPVQLLLRGVYLDPENRSGAPQELHLDGGFYGELSAAWFMAPVVSMELSLAEVSDFNSRIEQSQSALNSGPIRLMPNTWTLRYHFAPGNALRPYLGLGLHYTSVSISPVVGTETLAIESSKTGWVLQGGTDLQIARGWFLNADLRYLGGLDPHMTLDASTRITGYINPVLLGAGVGLRW